MRIVIAVSFSSLVAIGCSDSAGPAPAPSTGPREPPSIVAPATGGTEIRVAVPASGRAFVSLASPGVANVGGDPRTSTAWDLAFEGFDVLTNGGASGTGHAAAFGPLDATTWDANDAPAVPFTTQDKTGGAFLDWYAYDDTAHSLWSRYHVFGIQDGERLWKVQVLSYYAERNGAPVGAVYGLRYAEITAAGSGPAKEITGIDGTAGGAQGNPAAASECIDLGTGARTSLAVEAAQQSTAWHLCFRRSAIRVNGGAGGPRGIGAVDLEAGAVESIQAVEARTADTERAKFEAITHASFEGKTFEGDRIVSAFGDAWRDPTKPAPNPGTWLVIDASGQQKHFVRFESFDGPTATSPGTIVMRVKRVNG